MHCREVRTGTLILTIEGLQARLSLDKRAEKETSEGMALEPREASTMRRDSSRMGTRVVLEPRGEGDIPARKGEREAKTVGMVMMTEGSAILGRMKEEDHGLTSKIGPGGEKILFFTPPLWHEEWLL